MPPEVIKSIFHSKNSVLSYLWILYFCNDCFLAKIEFLAFLRKQKRRKLSPKLAKNYYIGVIVGRADILEHFNVRWYLPLDNHSGEMQLSVLARAMSNHLATS